MKLNTFQHILIASIAYASILSVWASTERFLETIPKPSDSWIRYQLSEQTRYHFEYGRDRAFVSKFDASVMFSDGTEQSIPFYRPLSSGQIATLESYLDEIATGRRKTLSATENQRSRNEIIAKSDRFAAIVAEYEATKQAAIDSYLDSRRTVIAVTVGSIGVPLAVFLLVDYGIVGVGAAIVAVAAGIVAVPVSVYLLIGFGLSYVWRGVKALLVWPRRAATATQKHTTHSPSSDG